MDDTPFFIVIVEDDYTIAEITETVLTGEGHRVRVFQDAQSALPALENEFPDLLLLDRMLPDMDGVALCEQIRTQFADRPYLPILMVTALDAPSDKAVAFALGADDYITKPFDVEDLLARVQVWGRAGRRNGELHRLRHLYAQSQRQAHTDPLTGLYNRRGLEQVLEQEIAKAQRLGYSMGLFVLDIDYFKAINDQLGHLCGDQVLVAAARALQRTLRRSDVLARFGGDEFVALLPGADANALRRVGEQLRRAIAELPLAETPGVIVTASIGGIAATAGGADAQHLLAEADQALYQAKAAGRNQVAIAGEQVPLGDASGLRCVPTRQDRRSDPLLRRIVGICQPGLEREGFQLAGRGNFDERSWVEFCRPEPGPCGSDGTLVLMMGHERANRALLVDAYYVDQTLEHTPRHKMRLQADAAAAPALSDAVLNAVRSWRN